MKRILTYIGAALAVVLLASCGREDVREAPEGKYIELTFANVTPPATDTKAGHSRGITAYNENLVQSVDCFFYPTGKTDSPAVFTALGRGAQVVYEADSLVYKVKIFFTDEDASSLFGSTTSGVCDAFVICNAPLSYGADTSVPALKELVLENDFSAQTVQGSFVMSAEDISTVTLSTSGTTTSAAGRVYVQRAAAKMQLYVWLPDEFIDEENQKWEPYSGAPVQILLANGVKRGKVDGNYIVQSSDYFNTYYRTMVDLSASDSLLVVGKEDYSLTSVPFYSYPQSWTDLSTHAPGLVFRVPWHIKGSTGGYEYKLYSVSPNMTGLKLERNHYYRTFVKVLTLGGADEDHTVVITDCSYEIIPWFADNSNAGQGLVPAELTTYKYLVIDHPEVELNNEPTARYTYASSSPISSVNVTKIIYYDNTKASPKQTLTSGTEFNTAKATITPDFSNPGYITLTHSLEGIYCQWEIFATVTNEDGISEEIHMVQNPSIRLERNINAGDVFVNGYFARVKNPPSGFGTIWDDTNNYYRDPISTNSSTAVTMPTVSGRYGTTISKGNSSSFTVFFTTIVDVSSFNTGNSTYSYVYNGTTYNPEYRIGDPRERAEDVYDSSWAIAPYLYYDGTASHQDGAWNSPLKILMTTQKADRQNVIAPRFLVSSSLNAMLTDNLPYFDDAVKRAAVYQEAGYPAGRWRIPTEAEMAFIVARQQEGTIPVLYSKNTYYWSGSGRRMQVADSGSTITMYANNNNKQSVRFVYDLWYWGDTPSTTNVYHPNGHIYNYDSTGNATAR